MTQRERPSSAGVAPPLPTAESPGPPHGPRNGDTPHAAGWEWLFPGLPPVRQQELLALAGTQGFLHASQLPPDGPHSADGARSFLAALLQGEPHDQLPPFRPDPTAVCDGELDHAQRDAVAKAIGTPDLCLIRGGPGTGKSRVIAEIIRLAARRGRRTLLVAPTAAGVDVVLRRLAGDPAVVALRGMGREERADHLPPECAARTFAVMRRQLVEVSRDRAAQSLAAIALGLANARAELTALGGLRECADRLMDLKARRDEVSARRDALPDEVRRSADAAEGDFGRRLKEAAAGHETELRDVNADDASAAAELQQLQKQLGELDTQIAAKQRAEPERGWLAKLLPFGPRVAPQVQEWMRQRDELRAAEAKVKQRAGEIAARRRQADERWQAERQRLLEAECGRRRAECDRQAEDLAGEIAKREQEYRQASGSLTVAVPADPAAVAQTCVKMRQAVEQAEGEEAFARRWGEFLAAHADELPARALKCVNLAAAPLTALAGDDAIAELSRSVPFDLLILDEAHRVSEADLQAAMKRARRWVLVGEPADESADPIPDYGDPRSGDPRGRRSGTATLARPSTRPGSGRAPLWPRLCSRLRSAVWAREGERLCCRLLPLTDGGRSRLEAESVADAPDTELRIWTPPRGAPALAEVLFPANTTAEQAILYLYHELNEIPVDAAAPRWDEAPGRLTCRVADDSAVKTVTLEAGVLARLAERGGEWAVVAIDFDPAAGWPRERAEAWANQTLRVADLGRTACLSAGYRMHAGVAAFVAGLGFDGGGAPIARPAVPGSEPAVEFIPVPALANEPQARRRGDVGVNGQQRRLPPLRGGAGFDIDLGDPRQRERLPDDLRSLLPGRGFVNVPEAEATVRLLENLLDDLPAGPERPESIAVVPLFAAQAELIRHLMNRSAALAACPIPLWVEAASRCRQREADLVIVGLTRSHGHRAVSYGDEPVCVPLALTRARRRLVLVGDPGTLARRAVWEGPLDHLDELAARRERDWVVALVRQLQGNGASAVHLREGPP